MLLALRGFDFAAGPAVYAGARWALYAERLMPDLARLKEVQAIDMRDIDRASSGRVGVAKNAAAKAIPMYRSVLFPEDDEPVG